MKRSLIIAEEDGIATLLENERVVEFFVNRGELLLGDVYTAIVENILPAIDAAFVNLGKDKMGFLHANDIRGQGNLKERLVPKQKLLIQITKEPTGHKGPRVSTAVSLPGKFLVLVPEEQGISVSRRVSDIRERLRLKSIINLMKPPGVGVIIRTEAKGHTEQELFDDFELLWDRWQSIVTQAEATIGPTLIYRDQDLLYRVIRDTYSQDMNEIILDSQDACKRAQEYLSGWASKNTKVTCNDSNTSLLVSRNIDKEIELALSDRVDLPSGGHLNIQPTEALTVIDVNSGRFTSSRTQAQTVKRTNLEAATEISRQLRLRNIGGMVIVDFIDMESRKDQQQVLEVFQKALEDDRAKPQLGQLSDLGLVELTRHRQGQSIRELFTKHCSHCSGLGIIPSLTLSHGNDKIMIPLTLKSNAVASNQISNNDKNGFLKAASAHGKKVLPVVSSNMDYNKFYKTSYDNNRSSESNRKAEELIEATDLQASEMLAANQTESLQINEFSFDQSETLEQNSNENTHKLNTKNLAYSDSNLEDFSFEDLTFDQELDADLNNHHQETGGKIALNAESTEFSEWENQQMRSEAMKSEQPNVENQNLLQVFLPKLNVISDPVVLSPLAIEGQETLPNNENTAENLKFNSIHNSNLDEPDHIFNLINNHENAAISNNQDVENDTTKTDENYLDAEFDPNTGIYRLKIKNQNDIPVNEESN